MAKDYENFDSLNDYIEYLVRLGLACNRTQARNMASSRIPKESYFQSKILKYLNSQPLGLRIKAWKNQAGMYQDRGLPDIESVIEGQFVGWEVKRPLVGKPTALQIAVADEIREAGGKVFFVSYVSEVEEILLDYFK